MIWLHIPGDHPDAKLHILHAFHDRWLTRDVGRYFYGPRSWLHHQVRMASSKPVDAFPIVEVDPGWTLQPEAMGGKRKFWYREPDRDTDWLFKYPRDNTGEHWAEKVAAEIAARLRILHGRVDLARVERIRGTATKSFINGRQLFHGNRSV